MHEINNLHVYHYYTNILMYFGKQQKPNNFVIVSGLQLVAVVLYSSHIFLFSTKLYYQLVGKRSIHFFV